MRRAALAAQTRTEVALTLRRGESVLLTLAIPAGLLVFFSHVDVLPRPEGVDEPVVVLILLNLVLLVLGMFLEPISILILTMPILLQFQDMIGMDPVQFGTMVVINVVIGMATPPVGILLFIVCAASGQPLTKVTREALPLIAICILVLAAVAAISPVTLFLPHAVMPVN